MWRSGFLLLLSFVWSGSLFAKDPSADISLFDCATVTWMKNCEGANDTYRRNPNSHLRMHDLNDLEFNFAPGTPSVMMRLMMERSPEAAKAAADYFEKHLAVATLSSMLWSQEITRRGGALRGTKTRDQIEEEDAMPEINTKNIKVYYFYDSKCPACQKMMSQMSSLRLNHADLQISAIQLDDDLVALKEINEKYYLDAVIVPAAKKDEYLKKVPTTPAVWVESGKNRQMHKIIGYSNYATLSKQLAEISK